MDSPISCYNRLASQIFITIADSQSANESSFLVGTHCILHSFGPLIRGADNETADDVVDVKAFIDDPSLKPKGNNLEVAVRVYTGDDCLNYENQTEDIISSEKKKLEKAAYENKRRAATSIECDTLNSPYPKDNILLNGKGQASTRSIVMSIAGHTTLNDRWSANNNFEKSDDMQFYTRGEGEKRTPAIIARIDTLFRSNREKEMCADAIRLDMESGAFYWVVMPKIPATKDELTCLAMTIDWGQFGNTFCKSGRHFMVQLPKFTTANSYSGLENILSKLKDNMGVSRLFSSDMIKVSSVSKVDVVPNKPRVKYQVGLPRIYKKKELRINKPFIFVHGAENGMIVDMGMFLKPLM